MSNNPSTCSERAAHLDVVILSKTFAAWLENNCELILGEWYDSATHERISINIYDYYLKEISK